MPPRKWQFGLLPSYFGEGPRHLRKLLQRKVGPPWQHMRCWEWHRQGRCVRGWGRAGGHVLAASRPGWGNRLLAIPKSSAWIEVIVRPRFQQRSPSPAGWASLTLVTEDAGECLAEGVWQYLPVFCWELPPDHVALIILGCLAAVLFVLRAGTVSKAVGRLRARWGEGGEANGS